MSENEVKTQEVVETESTKVETVKEQPKKAVKQQSKDKTAPKVIKEEKHQKDDVAEAAKRYPEHFINIALIIKNNAEIRRFTSIGIINYLFQKGQIKGSKRYVVYKWNKFSVRCDSLIREYYYTEPFFLNCLVAAFSSFSAAAQKTINTFVRKEMSVGFDKAIDMEEVNSIINENESHTDEKISEGEA